MNLDRAIPAIHSPAYPGERARSDSATRRCAKSSSGRLAETVLRFFRSSRAQSCAAGSLGAEESISETRRLTCFPLPPSQRHLSMSARRLPASGMDLPLWCRGSHRLVQLSLSGDTRDSVPVLSVDRAPELSKSRWTRRSKTNDTF